MLPSWNFNSSVRVFMPGDPEPDLAGEAAIEALAQSVADGAAR